MLSVGIRREDKNQWEARAPLTPNGVSELVRGHGISIVVQPSPIRAFPESDYINSGAVINEDLSGCDIILAVKEIPPDFYQPGKTYVFFSHSIKGQTDNMPLLRGLMEKNCQLIDYEKITDHAGRRLIFFGRHAGLVGMINTLWALGLRLKHVGLVNPFENIRQAVHYQDLGQAKQAILQTGSEIIKEGLPVDLCPLIFGFAGYGNVSRGAQEIFDLLPFERILPEELPKVASLKDHAHNILYKVIFKEEDLVRPVDCDRVFALKDYYDNPERYESKFEEHLPYLDVLINAIYWDERYPRLVTNDYLRKAMDKNRLGLKVIGDITCDVGGSIQCNLKATDSGNPVYVYDPATGTATDGVKGNGPVVLATDNLPCELGRESSEAFSEVLKKFIPKMVTSDFSGTLDGSRLPEEIKHAVIVWQGELADDYKYLDVHLHKTDVT